MPDPQGLNVHDLHLENTTVFDPQGRRIKQTHLQFSVGTHGPFDFYYDDGQDTAERINADIDRQIAAIRAVTARASQ